MKNLKNYKLLGEHQHSYELQDTKDGRSFHVAKNGLNLAMHSKIAKLPKFAKGGDVKHVDDFDAMVNSLSGNDGSAEARFKADQASMRGLPVEGQPEAAALIMPPVTEPAQPVTQPEPTASVPSDPVAEALDQSEYAKALGEEKQTYEKANQAQQEAGTKTAEAYSDLADDLDSIKNPLEIQQQYKVRSDELLNAFMNKEIDPQRFVKGLATGDRVGKILGLIFGGLGAGKNGENPGLTILNRQIDQDIDAQKNSQNKAYTLYKMNREATQDEIQASLATKDQMLTAVKARAMQFGAEASGPVAAAQRANLIAGIDSQLNDIHRKQGLLSAGRNGGMIGIDPAHLVGYIPEKQRAEAIKEINKAKQIKQLKDAMMQSEEQLEKSVMAGMFSPRDRESAINAFSGRLVKIGEGSFTKEQAEAFANSFFRSRFESKETTQHKAERLDEFFKTLLEDTAFKSGVGVGLDQFPSTRVKSSPFKLPLSDKRLDRDEVKSYIKKNINSSDPKVQSRVKFLINKYGVGQ